MSREDGARLLIDLAGTRRPRDQKSANTSTKATNREPYDPLKDQEKARQRQTWRPFEAPTGAEIETIAQLRGLSPQGVSLAAERGLLFCADSEEGRDWIVTDSKRISTQARRLDGQLWERINAKAWTLPGSVGSWPVGIREAEGFPSIALVEGSADLLAAMHLIWVAQQEKRIAPVAMFGASMHIAKSAIPHFKGKRIRIFADADEEGLKAEGHWWHQLESAGAKVDGYSFAGFLCSDGNPVKDLNDFALIDPDQWEARRDAISEAFRFSDRKEAA